MPPLKKYSGSTAGPSAVVWRKNVGKKGKGLQSMHHVTWVFLCWNFKSWEKVRRANYCKNVTLCKLLVKYSCGKRAKILMFNRRTDKTWPSLEIVYRRWLNGMQIREKRLWKNRAASAAEHISCENRFHDFVPQKHGRTSAENHWGGIDLVNVL